MKIFNSRHFTIYRFLKRFFVFANCCFLLACAGQNNTKQILPVENQIAKNPSAININTASVEELEKLPHIGETKARAIIEHREKFGAFRKPEHLLLVRGISSRLFVEIRNLIKTE